jgi:drug/metabolite transporter (DMT)-like permease
MRLTSPRADAALPPSAQGSGDGMERPDAAARGDSRAWALVAALTVIWGSSFFLIAVALGGFAPLPLAAGRVGFAALALAAALLATGVRLPRGAPAWGWCAALGAVGLAGPFTLLAWGQQTVPSAVASIYIAATPLFVLGLARLVFRDRIGRRKWTGFVVGLAGVAVLAGPDALRGLAGGVVLGQLACLGAAFCYASGAMLVRAMPTVEPLAATAAAHLAAAALLLPLGLADAPHVWPAAAPVAALVVLGVVQTGLAQFLRFVAIRRAGPVFVSVVGYLIPIWAGFLGVALLGETLSLRAVAAYGLILAGVLVARDRAA